ncbi:hypothetical protein [Lysobacter sp. CA199]|uniref:hypothetical protein n=1 Tax=Lysobacter sp. CA199 TaxID=3455608 RepID=UPI003F8D4597
MGWLSDAFAIASIVLPLLAVWMAVQFALLYRVNRKRERPLTNLGLAARAALGIVVGVPTGLALIAVAWSIPAWIGGPLEDPGVLITLLSLPAGAALGFIAGYLLGRCWVSRAWMPGPAKR